jgi:NAD(P)-dependent dehydrogenase (short-subunit alcohol dehydrogenase family)
VTSDEGVAAATAEILGETVGAARRAGQQRRLLPVRRPRGDLARRAARQLETNVVGVLRMTRAVLPAMRARPERHDRDARVRVRAGGGPDRRAYHASKWALEGMIESLRLELIPFGVRVVLIEPGPTTPMLHDNERLAAAGGGADSPYADLLADYRRQSAKLPRQDDLGR